MLNCRMNEAPDCIRSNCCAIRGTGERKRTSIFQIAVNLSKRSLFVFYPVHDVIGEDDIVETARKLFAVAYLKRDVFQRSVV